MLNVYSLHLWMHVVVFKQKHPNHMKVQQRKSSWNTHIMKSSMYSVQSCVPGFVLKACAIVFIDFRFIYLSDLYLVSRYLLWYCGLTHYLEHVLEYSGFQTVSAVNDSLCTSASWNGQLAPDFWCTWTTSLCREKWFQELNRSGQTPFRKPDHRIGACNAGLLRVQFSSHCNAGVHQWYSQLCQHMLIISPQTRTGVFHFNLVRSTLCSLERCFSHGVTWAWVIHWC